MERWVCTATRVLCQQRAMMQEGKMSSLFSDMLLLKVRASLWSLWLPCLCPPFTTLSIPYWRSKALTKLPGSFGFFSELMWTVAVDLSVPLGLYPGYIQIIPNKWGCHGNLIWNSAQTIHPRSRSHFYTSYWCWNSFLPALKSVGKGCWIMVWGSNWKPNIIFLTWNFYSRKFLISKAFWWSPSF